jgi:hypothetical protein
VRASAAFDAIYRTRFNGYKTKGRHQGLEWPRTAAYDREGYVVAGLPQEVKAAVCEMAIRELSDPNSMLPDLERGGAIQQIQAGPVSITYASNAMAKTTFQMIDGMVASLIMMNISPLAGSAWRG